MITLNVIGMVYCITVTDLCTSLLHLNQFQQIFLFFAQSLISALAVNRPADSKGFIIEKLKALITDNKLLRTLQWYAMCGYSFHHSLL